MNFFFKKYKLFFFVFCGIAALVLFLFYDALKPIKILPIYQPAMVNYELVDSTLQHVKKYHQIAPFKLTNQNGEIITQKEYDDKIYIA
jgi:protein SCO1/2